MQDKDGWDCIVEKMRVLNRVSTSSAIPMDLFHPATRLIKQGMLTIKDQLDTHTMAKIAEQ